MPIQEVFQLFRRTFIETGVSLRNEDTSKDMHRSAMKTGMTIAETAVVSMPVPRMLSLHCCMQAHIGQSSPLQSCSECNAIKKDEKSMTRSIINAMMPDMTRILLKL